MFFFAHPMGYGTFVQKIKQSLTGRDLHSAENTFF